jgi:hypothetical protein
MPLVMMKIKSKKVDRSSYWQGVVEETVSYEVQPLGEVELDEPFSLPARSTEEVGQLAPTKDRA